MLPSSCGAGLSLRRLLLCWCVGPRLKGFRVAAPRLTCTMACGIFLGTDWTHSPCIGRWILNHWTTREVLPSLFWSSSFTNFRTLSRLLECLICSRRACVLSHFRWVWPFVTPWTETCRDPLSTGFSRQESWSGLPCPPPWDLFTPGIEPTSLRTPIWQVGFYHKHHLGSPNMLYTHINSLDKILALKLFTMMPKACWVTW